MKLFIVLGTALTLLTPGVRATDYQTPPASLQQVVDQTTGPVTVLSRDQQWMAVMGKTPAPSIKQLAREEVKLAGLRINPESLTPSRIRSQYQSLVLIPLQQQPTVQLDIKLPKELTFTNGRFSPDNRFFSFTGITSEGAWLYLYNLESQSLKRLGKARLNATMTTGYQWLADSSAILFRQALDKNFDDRPGQAQALAPLVKATGKQKTPRRTYQDLLKNPADASYFSQLTESQLALITPKGKLTPVGEPGIFNKVSLSPDNQYLLTTRLTAPFSLRVKYYDFQQEVVITKLTDQSEKVIAVKNSGETRPAGPDSVTPGNRSYSWHPAKPASITWLYAADNGDSTQQVDIRDELYMLDAPFGEQPVKLAETPWRIWDIDWVDDDTALLTERSRKQQQLKVSLLDNNALTLWHQRGLRDTYKDPGKLYTARNGFGRSMVQLEKDRVLHYGLGASDNGYQPFLKQTSLLDGSSSSLWQTRDDSFQRVKYVLNQAPLELIISSERKSAPTAIYRLDVTSGKSQLLYQNPAALPAYEGIQKQLVSFTRKDGLPLSGTLYLPADYTPDQGPLPVLMWAYPREFKDKSVASRVAFSANQYLKVSPRSPVALVSQGYAVFDRVAMPIVGEGKSKPNDSFREQLVANAEAAIDKLVEMGVADRKRIAIGGHSYGAFMVANLLAHSDLFAAGIARSGAYNRSLTPFGFQNEERNFWQATDLYKEMSPFTHADKIDEPILLIHGEMDSNSGTYPMQSERLFNAIAGLGGTARLVMLPWESHSYVAKESLNHLLWEQLNWLDSHVKPTKLAQDKAQQGAL